ncbi:MAG: DUF4272 domain-containing protein [Lachnospiraceae bacterium]|nr:DUF4272 domain-containing protein [Lachnospiraceae bacterium]
MKSIKEIMVRAIILVCLSDRCALEEKIIEGRRYPISEREKQREAIRNWLDRVGYMQYATQKERDLFDKSLGKENKNDILYYQVQYEAVEPCLWSLGLVNRLSDYEQFVLEDFHSILQIGIGHSYEKVVEKCKPREKREIELQTEIAMLWHWRAREAYNPIFTKESIGSIVKNTFGKQYLEILSQIAYIDINEKDFVLKNGMFADLNDDEKRHIEVISLWRHHAFEWIMGNNSWDEVEVNT